MNATKGTESRIDKKFHSGQAFYKYNHSEYSSTKAVVWGKLKLQAQEVVPYLKNNKPQHRRMSCLKINYKRTETERVRGEQDTSVCLERKMRM